MARLSREHKTCSGVQIHAQCKSRPELRGFPLELPALYEESRRLPPALQIYRPKEWNLFDNQGSTRAILFPSVNLSCLDGQRLFRETHLQSAESALRGFWLLRPPSTVYEHH